MSKSNGQFAAQMFMSFSLGQNKDLTLAKIIVFETIILIEFKDWCWKY